MPVVKTDNSLALAQNNPEQSRQLQIVRNKQIMAVSMGLSGITANVLPSVMKNGEQVSSLRKSDEGTLIKAMIILIGVTNDDLNVPRMLPGQMFNAARHLIKTFWYFKPEEFAYAFDQGRAGRYGKVFNRLDLEILENWCTAYDTDERLVLCERSRSEEVENDNRLSVEQVHNSYQRSIDGEPSIMEIIANQKREAAHKERRAKASYDLYKDQYFQNKKAAEQPTEQPVENESN